MGTVRTVVVDLTPDVAAALTTTLAPILGDDLTVSDVRPLSSGASRQSWRFRATGRGQASRSYVLQREMVATGSGPGAGDDHLPMGAQAALLLAAGGQGVPVPPVVTTGEMEGRQFLITEWLPGEALPPKLLHDPELAPGRARLMGDCARALASIHAIPLASQLGLVQEDGLAVYRSRLDSVAEPRPVLEFAYRWLVRHRPEPAEPPVVVHGDFRLGNLLVDEGGLRAVLDWELAHAGDRHEDLAWATIRAWRFDRHREAGEFPDADGWLAAYESAVGPDGRVNRDVFRWWQVAGTWKWAVMSALLARRHLDGWVASLEHATIGRRVCESEWDLLDLLA